MSTRYIAGMLLSGIALLLHPSAKAAESYDGCTGFIESVPAVISTQGTWCLRRDLSTAMTTGAAIRINTNNVAIDCNGFKLGGLAAGATTQTHGIATQNRLNATVRNCNVRGFFHGVHFDGGAGHLIENNRFDNNMYVAVFVDSDGGNVIRGNTINDTGGSPFTDGAIAVSATADVINNTIDGVYPVAGPSGSALADGISVFAEGVEISGNRVRGLTPVGQDGSSLGIWAVSTTARIANNHIAQTGTTIGYGILAGLFDDNDQNVCLFNSVLNYETDYFSCASGTGNQPEPMPTVATAKKSQDARQLIEQRRRIYGR